MGKRWYQGLGVTRLSEVTAEYSLQTLIYSQTEDQLERDGDDGGIVSQDTHIGVKVGIVRGLNEIGWGEL